MNINVLKIENKFVATLEGHKEYDKAVIAAIPAYGRHTFTLNILGFYAKYGIDCIACFQAFPQDILDEVEALQDKYNVKIHMIVYEEAQLIGKVRKEIFKTIVEDLDETYKFILMQDNDIFLTKKDVDVLLSYGNDETGKFEEYYVFSPDLHYECMSKDYVQSRLCFGCQLLRTDEVAKIYANLTEVPANEDSELIYLLENRGLCINKKFFDFKFEDLTKETVYENKIQKLAEGARILKEKYGDDCEVVVRDSGKTITKFSYERKFPMKLRFNEKPHTKFYDSTNNMKITMTSWPHEGFRRRCYDMIKATWADKPIEHTPSEKEIQETFDNLLSYKVLPNSMEHMQFTFLIEGLNLVSTTHLLRHRVLSSIHAQCSADRDLRHDSVFIPSSIKGTKFEEQYKKLTEQTKQLYADMIDSKEISILEARYILPRNQRYFYYVTMNLKDAMGIIKQRSCTQIQPEEDNLFAHMIYYLIAEIVPEIKEKVSLMCGPKCFYLESPNMDNSRIYQPDKNHSQFVNKRNSSKYFYDKTRKEMGVLFNPQD